jgi:NAD(P)-dependent dehydrogenase (short-subunit alcohol dehydrogenase family)
VWNLTKSLAVEWAPLGLRINCLAPGPTDTEAASANLFPTPEIRDRMTAEIPLRRFATLDDIVASARFLLSDEASYVTGETLVLDGGESLPRGMFFHSPRTPKG